MTERSEPTPQHRGPEGTSRPKTVLITLTGKDRPGVTSTRSSGSPRAST
jgi:hypothetical protein